MGDEPSDEVLDAMTGTPTAPPLRGQFDWAPADARAELDAVERTAERLHEVAASVDSKMPYANPKDAVGSGKLPLHLVPDSLSTFAALAFAEGALKYGAYNWRCAPVRASIYVSALRRHLAKWMAGEHCDAKTMVPHLASAIACLAIIVDAIECDTLIDDRPPSQSITTLIDADAVSVLLRLQELYGDVDPHHCTIADSKKESR